MGISVKTDSDTDEVVTLEWTNTEHDDTYTAQIWLSPVDGVTTVQIDTPADVGRVRVMLNDGPIWDGDPETDIAPGAQYRNHPVIQTADQSRSWDVYDEDGEFVDTVAAVNVAGALAVFSYNNGSWFAVPEGTLHDLTA